MTTRIYCIRCGGQVGGPTRGTLGLTGHTGHLDRTLDRTCGTWGYRDELASDIDEEEGYAMTGAEFKALRKAAGLTWEEAAGALGVGVRTIARWEASPSARLTSLAAIAAEATFRAAIDGEPSRGA